MSCAALVLGLHLATAHFDAGPGMRGENPGAYVVCDSLIAGTYRNSLNRTTVYAGYRWDLTDAASIALVVGTGYQRTLQIGVVPSVRIGPNWRLHFILPTPVTGKGGVHVSWEMAL